MVGISYWIIEYLRVLFAYGFTMFVWPSVIFHKHLKGKSKTYRFCFCTTVSVLLINIVVLVLGIAHLLFNAVTIILFYGSFLIQLYRMVRPKGDIFIDIRRVHNGIMSPKHFVITWFSKLVNKIKSIFAALWRKTKGNRLSYALLFSGVLFGLIYFSYIALDTRIFGCSDEYVHAYWVDGLINGKVFIDGVYPYAMHTFLYVITSAFGIRLYNCVLFLGGIHAVTLLVSIFLLFKELFRWKYTAHIALFALLFVAGENSAELIYATAFSRIAWTLPLEFGMYAMFIAALYLVRFFKKVAHGEVVLIKWKKIKDWKNLITSEELLMLMTSVAVVMAAHFHTLIIAFFVCISIVIVFIRQFFKKGSFAPVFVSVLLAIIVAVLPMVTAFAVGYNLQGSLLWGLSEISMPDDNNGDAGSDASDQFSDGNDITESEAESELESENESKLVKLFTSIQNKCEIIYYDGLVTLHGNTQATEKIIVWSLGLILFLPLHFVLYHKADKKKKATGAADHSSGKEPEKYSLRRDRLDRFKNKFFGLPKDYFDGYLVLITASFVVLLLYTAGSLHLPSFIASTRVASTDYILHWAVIFMALDVLFELLRAATPAKVSLTWASCAFIVGIYIASNITGDFHGYLYTQFTRYPAISDVTEYIVDNYPDKTFTIISPTDEYYQILGKGYHEELLTFLNNGNNADYTIPTEYIILYIEKRPLAYAVPHYSEGPRWFAYNREKNSNLGYGSEPIRYAISDEDAEKSMMHFDLLSDYANNSESRIIMESKAYKWYKDFSEMYPNDGKVIYEDDNVLCYRITQNVYSLYSLGIYSER